MVKLLERGYPLPDPPTHLVVIDILNKDTSIKRVTISFNENDLWMPSGWLSNINAKTISAHIAETASFLGMDKAVYGWKAKLYDIKAKCFILEHCGTYLGRNIKSTYLIP